MNRVPMRTSSSGKASTARRNWSAVTALDTASRLAERLMDASPQSRQGVPPMRSRVQKENPTSLPPSRPWVMSTHSSRCLDSSPMSKPAGPSVQMSAISASSASLSAVQSLVSISIAMSCAFLSSHTHPAVPRLRGFRGCVPKTAGAEQHAQLTEEAGTGIHGEIFGQPDDFGAHVQEDLGGPGMVSEELAQPAHPVVGEGVDGQLEMQRWLGPLQDQLGPAQLH